MAFDTAHLERLRLFEIEQLKNQFEPGKTVLEIGAGAGWQARYLSELGLRVMAVDIPATNYNFRGNWNVILYDGHRLPLASQSVDYVYSSNVLEHIPHVEAFQGELLRVLKADGKAIHLIPSTAWRFWTSLTKYVDTARRIQGKVKRRRGEAPQSSALSSQPARRLTLAQRLADLFIPETHGEAGNTLTELYYFNRLRWSRLFRRTGWQLAHVSSNHLFYTGYFALGAKLSLRRRQQLQRWLGAACHVYVLKPNH